ncbi:MAG: hypothetical protein WCO57_13435 [Verrucomicrobiota bacterium]
MALILYSFPVAAAKAYLNACLRHSYQFPSPGGGTLHALNQGTVRTISSAF